jgi:hypothetical protein
LAKPENSTNCLTFDRRVPLGFEKVNSACNGQVVEAGNVSKARCATGWQLPAEQ